MMFYIIYPCIIKYCICNTCSRSIIVCSISLQNKKVHFLPIVFNYFNSVSIHIYICKLNYKLYIIC